MRTWPKTPQATIAAFESAVPSARAVVKKKMFGYPAAFVNGNMFAGTFRDDIVVRLEEYDRGQLLESPGAKPFEPMPGRPMTEYVAVPPSFVRRPAELTRWIARAHRYAAKLPAKEGPSAGAKAPKKAAAKKRTARRPAPRARKKVAPAKRTAKKTTKRR
jgi:TfoX/Sxy family transcriptional regulator of competence genes